MKKNSKLLRASGILLVLTLITSCFVGGTFAKYTTSEQGDDTARVAKWGVTVEVANGKAFSTEYGKDDIGANESDVGKNTVVSNTEEKVLAPGTKGSFGGSSTQPALTISGKPEVAVRVNTEATVTLNNWTDKSDQNTDPYCPLVFTITCDDGTDGGRKEQIVCGLHYDQNNGGVSSFATKIEKAIEDALNGDYPAKTELDDLKLYITWEWPFNDPKGTPNSEHADHSAPSNPILQSDNTWSHEDTQNDDSDTILGNKTGDDVPTIEIDLTTTVTQID